MAKLPLLKTLHLEMDGLILRPMELNLIPILLDCVMGTISLGKLISVPILGGTFQVEG